MMMKRKVMVEGKERERRETRDVEVKEKEKSERVGEEKDGEAAIGRKGTSGRREKKGCGRC